MKKFVNSTVEEYMERLSAREMVPGGGSAAALVAATGVGLNLMVINYTKFSKDKEKAQKNMKEQQQEILDRLLELIDEDCKYFKNLMKVLSDGDNAQREYLEAAKVPMEICRGVCIALATSREMLSDVNKSLITDVECAAHMLKAAFYSAKINIEINLKHLKGETQIKSAMVKEIETMSEFVEDASKDISADVKAIMRGE